MHHPPPLVAPSPSPAGRPPPSSPLLQADVGSHPNLLTALDALLRGETADALSAALHRAQQAAEQRRQQEQQQLLLAQLSPECSPRSTPSSLAGTPPAAASPATAAQPSPPPPAPEQPLPGAAAAAADLRQQVLGLLAALEGSLVHAVEEEGCAHVLLSLQQLLAARELSTRIMVLQVGGREGAAPTPTPACTCAWFGKEAGGA
jgi:hypothetical protein